MVDWYLQKTSGGSHRKMELMFEACQKSCVESIERIFCAGMCDENQANFLTFDPTNYAVGKGATLKVSNKLCSTVFQACQDAKDLHGNVYRYKYKNKANTDPLRRMAYSIFMDEELELYFVNQYSQTGVSLRMNIECVSSDTNSSQMLTEEQLKDVDGNTFEFREYCTKEHENTAILLIVFLLMLIVGKRTPSVARAPDRYNSWLITLACFFSGMHFANFLVQHHILWFPESGVYTLVGMFVAFVLLIYDAEKAPSLLNLDAETLNLLLLPPIIFEAGYELKSQLHFFRKNIVAILCFAVFGTLISTVFVGLSLSAIFPNISTLEALMFGSLISAVDPVATLATFAHVHVNHNLETIVFGESLVNDAMAIVLYRTFKHATEHSITNSNEVSAIATWEFFSTCLGSSFVGVLLGASTMVYFRYISFRGNTDMQAMVLIFAAYCSFLISEGMHFSGILATLVCGVWCAVFTDRNLSDIGDDKTHTLSKQFAGLAEMTLFVLAGMMTCLFTVGGQEPAGGGRESFGIHDWSTQFFFVTLGLILVARAIALWPIAWVLNWIDAHDGDGKITRHLSNRNLIMMWVSGLRGAIAIGLAMDLPTPHRHTMLTTTCMIVLFTTFVMGGSTPFMLHLLKVTTGHKQKRFVQHQHCREH